MKSFLFIFLSFCSLISAQDLHIMVATGYDGDFLDHNEVINTETIASCSNLPAKYPEEIRLAVALQHDSKMVICGGSPRTGNCYGYSNDQWNLEAFRIEPSRYGAMSIEIRPGEWLIMGGYDSSNVLRDTKLLKNGIFLQGPDLPEPIYAGSAVMLNQTHLFVAAGRDHYSPYIFSIRNYLLNINTNQWT